MSYKRNGGKLHGNISQNGYGNAIIGRYGGCIEEGIWQVYDTGKVKAKEITKYWKINMMKIDPGAIGFTSGFSQDSMYYGG